MEMSQLVYVIAVDSASRETWKVHELGEIGWDGLESLRNSHNSLGPSCYGKAGVVISSVAVHLAVVEGATFFATITSYMYPSLLG